jgi:hypothetical protein
LNNCVPVMYHAATTRPSTAVHPGLTSEVSPPLVGDSSSSAVDAAADEADGEEWNDRLALAGDDELDALAARLGGYKPTQASLLAAEEADAAREAARGGAVQVECS